MIFDELRALIGTPPAGYEIFEYIFAGIFLIILEQSCISFISALFSWIGGKR